MKEKTVKKLYQIDDEVLVLIGKAEVTVISKNDPAYNIVEINNDITVNNQFEENLDLALEDWVKAVDEEKIKEKVMKKVGLQPTLFF